MKKTALFVVVVLAVACLALFFYFRSGMHAERAAEWLPADTAVFEEMPDLQRTKKRWPLTALAQIWNEPQVRAFLEKPKSKTPGLAEVERRNEQRRKIDPTRFFLGVTGVKSGEKGAPKVVLGLAYAGSKEELESLVGELRHALQKAWPAGKTDIAQYGSGEIESFTVNGHSGGLAWRGHWLFLASDLDLLKSTVDGFEGRTAAATLRNAETFKKCLEQLPAEPDNIMFVQPALLAEGLSSMMMMLAPQQDTHQMDYMRKIQAYAIATKMDGPLMRESTFVLRPAPEISGPLADRALQLATENTVVLASGGRQKFDTNYVSQLNLDSPPIQQLLAPYLKAFKDAGLTLDQFAEAFGPESGFLLDWPQGNPAPIPEATLDVRDAGKARRFLDKLASMGEGAQLQIVHQELNGVNIWTLPMTGIGILPLQFTLALTDKVVLAGLNLQTVRDAAMRPPGPGGLAGKAEYKEAMGLVQAPTIAHAYLDTKTIFERIYNLVRGVAAMGLVPHSGDYVDLTKLPDTETISRHLSPLVVSSAAKGEGILGESAGPVTPMQLGGLAGFAAVPVALYYYQQMAGPGTFPRHRPASALPMPPATPVPARPFATPFAAPTPAASPSPTAP